MKRILSILCAGLLPVLAGASIALADGQRQIRVAVLQDAASVPIAIQGSYEIIDVETSRRMPSERALIKTTLKSDGPRIVIEDMVFETRHIRIVPRSMVTVWLSASDKKNYRGAMDIYLQDNRKLLLVNALDVEQYIKGVLQHEISDKWPMEAIKAQAVAVRTYAYYQIFKNKTRVYDVTGDIYSQVYGGASAERQRTNAGTDATAGMVLISQGLIFPAYFHSTCGGHTEDARNLWENEDVPSLRGRECGFCAISPHYTWKRNYRSKEVQDKLNAQGYDLGLIKEIRVSDRTPSGRIKKLQIETRDGKKVEITGKIFRDIVGPNTIKSNNYDIEMKGYYFDLIGHGWGHGVGLCQWGTLGMAREAYTYKEILKYYYPQSELVKIDQAQFKMPQKAVVSGK